MSSTLTNLQQANNWATLDNVVAVSTDELYIDGELVDIANLVPYTGATKTLNLNSQNATTSHIPSSAQDLTNKAYVDAAVSSGGTGKVPYIGAVANVDLGAYTLRSGGLTDTGSLSVGGAVTLTGLAAGTPTYTLGINGSNQLVTYANPSSTFTGSVSAGYLPYASSTNVLANSLVSQSGSTVTNAGNDTVTGVVDLTGGAVTTSKASTGWGAPYFTATGGNTILNYTYASGQGVMTSTAGAPSMAVFATGVTISGSYLMALTAFKTSSSSIAVSINIRQGSTYAGSTIIKTVMISGSTVAQDLSFNFSTVPNYGVGLIFEVIAYAGPTSSSLAYFNTITLSQLGVQLVTTNVVGKLIATNALDVTGGLVNNGALTNTGNITNSGDITNSGTLVFPNNNAKLAAPATGGGGVGKRIVFWDSSSAEIPYAIGMSASTLWYSSPATQKWYCGNSGSAGVLLMDLSSTELSVYGNVSAGKDFYIGANSSAWNTTYGKGLYVRYSTNGGQDSTYIQSIDRSTNTAYPMELEASKFNFAVGNVGIGNKTPGSKLDVNGNANIGTSMSVGTSLSTGTYISAGSSITAGTTIQSGTSVTDGSISLFAKNGQATQTYEFYVGGANRDTFCPVFINTDNAWSNANVALFEIGRSSVHTDGSGLGAFQYIYQGHNTNWGHGAEYIYHKYRGSAGWTYTRFIADVVQDGTTTVVVVWLRANLTYYFSSRNGCYVSFFPKTTTPYPVYTGGGANPPYYTKSSLVGIFNALTFSYDSRADQTSMDGTNYFSTIQPNRIVDSYTKVVRAVNANWGGGYWIYNAFYRASTNSTVTISGCVSGYISSPTAVTVGIGVQPANNSYFAQIWGVSPYVNNVYNYMPFPFTANYNTPFSTDGSTGWYHIYLWNAYGILTDTNAYVNVAVTVTMHTP